MVTQVVVGVTRSMFGTSARQVFRGIRRRVSSNVSPLSKYPRGMLDLRLCELVVHRLPCGLLH